MIPLLGKRGAAELHRELTEWTAPQVLALGATGEADVEIWHEGGDRQEMNRWLGPLPRYRRQQPGNLGDRLRTVFETAFREGARRCIALASDCPSMTTDHLRSAFAQLHPTSECHQGVEVVLGPSADGGYWLIGLSAEVPDTLMQNLFREISWSTSQVLRETLDRVKQSHLSFALLDELVDIDYPEDLAEWRRCRGPARNRTSISVIIPTIQEEQRIRGAIASARHACPEEIIVADGGSEDRTRLIASNLGALVVRTKPGRALQMNRAARHATGDVLLFLHADTLLPKDSDLLIGNTLRTPGAIAGAFGYRASGAGLWDPILSVGGQARCHLSGHPYGDQGLFLHTRTFWALGGFPEIPVMEDWEIVRRLRRMGRVVVVDKPAVTSASSFAEHGILRAALWNLVAIFGYQMGVSPNRLAEWRNRIARRSPP